MDFGGSVLLESAGAGVCDDAGGAAPVGGLAGALPDELGAAVAGEDSGAAPDGEEAGGVPLEAGGAAGAGNVWEGCGDVGGGGDTDACDRRAADSLADKVTGAIGKVSVCTVAGSSRSLR